MSQINIPTPPSANLPGLSTVNPAAEAKPAQMTRKVRTPAEPKHGW